jgi:hypothetical protein
MSPTSPDSKILQALGLRHSTVTLLGEVACFVDVATQLDRHVVGEKLEGDYGQDRAGVVGGACRCIYTES